MKKTDANTSQFSGPSLKNKRFKKYIPVGLLVLWDIISTSAAVYIAIILTFSVAVKVPNYYRTHMPYFILGITCVVIFFNLVCGCYNRVLRTFSFTDILRQGVAVLLDVGAMFVTDTIVRYVYVSRNSAYLDKGLLPMSTYLIIAMLLLVFLTCGRGFGRFIAAVRAAVKTNKTTANPVVVYGAGEAGTYFLKKVATHPEMNMRAVALIDDDKDLHGLKIGGVPIVGGMDMLSQTIERFHAQQVVLAIPTAPRVLINSVIDLCKDKHCALRRFGTIDDAEVSNMRVSEINLEDLLRRGSVNLNMNIVRALITDKVVMVTGGAGSIGSEICRQVLRFGCKKLVVFDIHENGLFDIDNELREHYAGKFEVRLGSVRDRSRLEEVFNEFNPEIVLHAAAHKHVPMMEINPREAIKNNVMGTINTAQVAVMHGVKKFILISTDKAVNPTNIMGASKRITELVIQMMDTMSDTEFAAVRFGNVLGSNGSVVPFFRKQIERGGPVTVTHPDMRRYFMTIPEAVQLVLEAGAMAKGGEIFVLDMGQPVLIYDLAKDLIRLSGYEPDRDIQIVFTGLRPGEKLFEEISLANEDVDRTSNKKIMIMKPIELDQHFLARTIKDMEEAVCAADTKKTFELVKVLVPTFDHK